MNIKLFVSNVRCRHIPLVSRACKIYDVFVVELNVNLIPVKYE